ncbi:hypothetical protein SAMN04488090_3459 [Siphonobacter aquaeclarae]|uniref:Uncharacterized protein n=1 Tax=Siphonobacter aquaeclarae TaxID=563176 RepID=A0A1G9T8T4_9BACT|nr:hypothetical protein SAMN04488090_3459 [Siphonobacter aquaeclarae]
MNQIKESKAKHASIFNPRTEGDKAILSAQCPYCRKVSDFNQKSYLSGKCKCGCGGHFNGKGLVFLS